MIELTFQARDANHAKEIISRVHDELHITDDMIRDYLVRKGWWKPGVENGPVKKEDVEDAKNKVARAMLDAVNLVERKNVSPGIPLIGKIGTSTKEELLLILGTGVQPKEKFKEHLKLLWSRGEIKYDGKEFYL